MTLKQTLRLTGGVLTMLLILGAGKGRTADDKAQNNAAHPQQQLREAMNSSDTRTLSTLLADNVIWLSPSGKFLPKNQVLSGISSGKLSPGLVDTQTQNSRDYGDTLIVYTTTHPVSGGKEQAILPKQVVTDVFVRSDGKWLLVAHGATPVIGDTTGTSKSIP